MAHIRRRKVSAPVSTEALLEGLNPEQTQVVLAGAGAFQVLAGAGAGKTRSLVNRVAYLGATKQADPRAILAVTFSRKAAEEMNTRLLSLGVTGGRIGTWHSLCLEIIKAERPDLTEWQIDDRDRFRIVTKEVLGYRGMKWATADLSTVLTYIGLCKANLAEPGSITAQEIADKLFAENPCGQTNPRLLGEAYFRAQEAAAQRQLLTFDDFLVAVWKILSEDDDAAQRWSGRFTHILQDEAQDENIAQATIAELLARPHGNYMIVGDPAQSIYGFRGAAPTKFAAFPEEWPGCEVIRMNRNYRSGAEVIDAANRVAACMAPGTSLGVDMVAERGTSARVDVREFNTMDEEGEEVGQTLAASNASGVEWRDMAVLYRTNAQSRGVEEALLANRIPYVVIGGTNFYDRKEVKDLLAYLRVGEGRGDAGDVKRCINSPFRFLGRAFTDRVEGRGNREGSWTDTIRVVSTQAGIQSRQRQSVEEFCGLIDSISRSIAVRGDLDITSTPADNIRPHLPSAILERVISETDYMKYITRDEGAETVENNRVSNVRELVRASERFTTVAELLDYVDATLRAAREAKETGDANRVTLCSLHRAKGLEWPSVFVIGVNEKILPHGRATDIEEERRLFYVGVTRARDALHLSHVSLAAFGAKLVDLTPSRFLVEAGLLTGEAAEITQFGEDGVA